MAVSLALLLGIYLASTTSADVIQPTHLKQKIAGFGTSLCWWAVGVGNWKNETRFDEVMDLFFSPDKGLGLTQVRYNIGGGETYVNSHFLRAGGHVASYLEADGRWNWAADIPQRRVLAAAVQRGVKYTMAFSNSPPAFMTVSGSVTGAQGGANNLAEDQYDAFASYLATVVKHFQSADYGNIEFDAVTPLNEPVARWWKYGNGQEGCHFDRDKQSAIVAKLGAALRNASVARTIVAGPEENSLDDTILSLKAYAPEALAELGLITSHTYNGDHRSELSSLAASLGKPLWNSEYGDGGGALQGGIALAQRIITDLNYLNISVWTLWQTLDLASLPLPTGGWGGLAGSFHEEKLYHIRLGSPEGPCVTAADNTDGGNLTVGTCTAEANQVFSILDTQIKTVNSAGLCFDAWGQSMQPGDRISLYSCWNGDNQQWQPSQQDRQIYLNNASGLCLAGTPSATGLTAEVCNNSSNTRWYIQSVTEGVTLANGTASRYVDNTPEEYLIRAQYYAFKQFTAFVQPNDVILGSTDTSNTTLLAQKPDGRVVVVLVNTATDASQSWTIQLNQAAGQAAEVYLSDDTHDCERMSDVAVGSDGKLEVTLGSSSIATYVVRSNSFS